MKTMKKFSLKITKPDTSNNPLQVELFNKEKPKLTLEDKFPLYHKDNPQIYDKFKEVTFEAIAIGHKHFAAEFIFNQIRWKTPVQGDDQFKINNNYKAFYARMFMNEFPEYGEIFTLRTSKYDNILNNNK